MDIGFAYRVTYSWRVSNSAQFSDAWRRIVQPLWINWDFRLSVEERLVLSVCVFCVCVCVCLFCNLTEGMCPA